MLGLTPPGTPEPSYIEELWDAVTADWLAVAGLLVAAVLSVVVVTMVVARWTQSKAQPATD